MKKNWVASATTAKGNRTNFPMDNGSTENSAVQEA